jgi:bifunctional DNA-binding transcriptional regulator/antitoxin component of YhaV-PrlF toxin-antitoxin module
MAKNTRADESILNSATSNGISLRTTIPSYIVAKMELKKGDKFRWFLNEEKGYLFIRPIRKDEVIMSDDKTEQSSRIP